MKLNATQIEAKATEAWGKQAFVIPYRIAGNRTAYAVTDHGDHWLPLNTSWNGDGQVLEPIGTTWPWEVRDLWVDAVMDAVQLALAYFTKEGDMAGARAACERALAIDEAAFGREHPKVARDVNSLGTVLRDLGDLARAPAAFERALTIDQATFGPDHPNVARDVNNLGGVLQALGDSEGARAAHQRALSIWEQAYGREHPKTAQAIWCLGTLAVETGNVCRAREYLEEALAILQTFLPALHPQIAELSTQLEAL